MLNRDAADLLLMILEGREPVMSGEVLEDYFPQAGSTLREAGLLIPDGHELVATAREEHSDAPVTVIRADEDSEFGYFSSTAGWVAVDAARLVRYRVDLRAFVCALVPLDTVLAPHSPVPVLDGLVWEVGHVTLGRRPTTIWFARRLHDPAVWSQGRTVLRQRPSARIRVILTSTPADRLPEERLQGSLVISVADLIDHDGGRIDEITLAARLAGDLLVVDKNPLVLSPDGRLLTIAGSTTIQFKSEKQQAVIRQLVEGHSRGERFGASELLNDAGLEATTFQRAFGPKKWRQLQPFLKTRSGLWGFEI